MDVDVYTPEADSDGQSQNVLDTVEGEIHFFRALMRSRPVGINRHFHVITMQAAIEKGTKRSVPIDDIWRKLESCYNLDALEALEAEYESNANPSSSSTPQPVASPRSGQNLATHPFFRTEFALPSDSYVDELIAQRRARETPSPPSTPLPEIRPAARRGRKRKPSKADLAGLVSGDSDSSDLTQQSGEEGAVRTPSERRGASIATGTDPGTEDMQDEDDDKGEADPSIPKQPRRGGRRPGRGRGSGRGSRKRKR
ncbi:chromatin modification-related protein EAF7-domain-containing protein [Phellopilus nigrolimitatus]|nr:chromatin modification-related protein EAF7-domain-containing protein [Phellopilus nigrolimitatus]